MNNGHNSHGAIPPARWDHDSLGEIEIPTGARWGAQTARSLHFFAIGQQRMPIELIRAIALIKAAAAQVNGELGLLQPAHARAIARAAQRVAEGEFDAQFPLSVWQTGSGTHSHMNVNEVVAQLANETLPGQPHSGVDAHDHVNLGQSSNDVFPSAMHIAVALQMKARLLPALQGLHAALLEQAQKHASVLKPGRTHMQDAIPITLGQEFGGYAAQLALCETTLRQALPAVHTLALGGTAVGTGLNTHPGFGAAVTAHLAERLQLSLVVADNLFAALAGHEALVALHGGLRMLAVALTKIACDIRLMGSGPRAGLGELQLPANEPGSSIMPGKANPTQVEALTMVCAQVMGHDTAIGFAASQGQFELNTYKPLVALNVLDSIRLLADSMRSFAWHCVSGLQPNLARLQTTMQASLMLGTALAPHIGHERAAQVAHRAQQDGSTLREAALALHAATPEQFDAWVNPLRMLSPDASASD
jgi:fumarate hydratase, class II